MERIHGMKFIFLKAIIINFFMVWFMYAMEMVYKISVRYLTNFEGFI